MGDKSLSKSNVGDKDGAHEWFERGRNRGRFNFRPGGSRRLLTGAFRPYRSRFPRSRGGSRIRTSGYHSHRSESSRRRSRTRSRSRSRSPSRASESRSSSVYGRYYPSNDRRRSDKRRSRSRSRERRSRSREHRHHRSRSRSRTRYSRSPSVRLYSPGRIDGECDAQRDEVFRGAAVGADSLTDLSLSYSSSVSNDLLLIGDCQDRRTSPKKELLRVTVDNDHFASNRHLWKPVGHQESSPPPSYLQNTCSANVDNAGYSLQCSGSIRDGSGVNNWDLINIDDEEEKQEEEYREEYEECFEIQDMGPGRNWDRRSDQDYRSRGGNGGGYRGRGRGGRNNQNEHVSSIVPKHTSSIVPLRSVGEEVWKIPKVLSARDMDAYDDDVHSERYAAKVRDQPRPVLDVKPKVEPMLEVKIERTDMFGDDTSFEMKYDPSLAAATTTSSTTSSYYERDSSRTSSSGGLPGLGFDEPPSHHRASHSRSFLVGLSNDVSRSSSPPSSPKRGSGSSSFTIPGLGNIGNMNTDEEDEFLYGDEADDQEKTGRGSSRGSIPGLGDFSGPMTSTERRSSVNSLSRQAAVASSDPRNLGKILNKLGYDAGNSTLGSSAGNNNDNTKKRTAQHVARTITDLYHRLHDGSDKPEERSTSTVSALDPRSIPSQGAATSSDRRLQSRQGSLDAQNETNSAVGYPLHQDVAPEYHNRPAPVAAQYSEFAPEPCVSSTQPGYPNYQYDAYYGSGYPVQPIPTNAPPPPLPLSQHQHMPAPIANYQIPPQPMYPAFPSHPPPSVPISISTTDSNNWSSQSCDSQINRTNLKVVPIQSTSVPTVITNVCDNKIVAKTSEQSKGLIKKETVRVPTTLEERMQLKGEYAQQQKKLELLRVELERSRRQQGELMRKKQKQKDGHNDPQLLKNAKLQDDYKRQISSIEVRLAGIEKALKASEGLNRSVSRSTSSDKSSSRSDSRQSKSTEGSTRGSTDTTKQAVPSKQYRFVDSGDNWCKHCGNIYPLAPDLLKHLHSDHINLMDNLDPADRPWAIKPKEPKSTSAREISVKLIQGVEFMLPCLAYFCKLCKEFYGDVHAARTHLESERHNAIFQKHCQAKPDYLKRIQAERAASVARKREEKKRKIEQELKEAVTAKKQRVSVAKRDSDMEISDGDDDDVVAIQPSTNLPIRLNLLNEKESLDKPESREQDGKSSSKIAIKLKEKASVLPTSKKTVTTSVTSDQQRTQQRILSTLYKSKKNKKDKTDGRVQQPPLEEFVSLVTVSSESDKSKMEMIDSTEVSKENHVKITPQLPKEPLPIIQLAADEMELLPPGVDHLSVNVPMPCPKPRSTPRLQSPTNEEEEETEPAVEIGPQLPDFDDMQCLVNVVDSVLVPDVLDIPLTKEQKNVDGPLSLDLTVEDPTAVSSNECEDLVATNSEKIVPEIGSKESILEPATEKNVDLECDEVDVELENGKVDVDLEGHKMDIDLERASLDSCSKENKIVYATEAESDNSGKEVVDNVDSNVVAESDEAAKDCDVDGTTCQELVENSSIECDRDKVASQDTVRGEPLLESVMPPQDTDIKAADCDLEDSVISATKMETNVEESTQNPVTMDEDELVDVKPDVRLLDEAIARSKRPQMARCSRGRGRAASVAAQPMLAKVKVEPQSEEVEESKVVAGKASCRGKVKSSRGRGRPRRGSSNVGTRLQVRSEKTADQKQIDEVQVSAALVDELSEQTSSGCRKMHENGERETTTTKNSSDFKVKLECDLLSDSKMEVRSKPAGDRDVSSPAASDLSFGDMEILDEAEDTD